jgi:hypothetical protein
MVEDIWIKVSKMSGDKEDVQNLKEVLDVVSQKVPELLEKVTGAMYGAENAKKFAVAVAEFYKSLKEAGMTDEQAYDLTKQYMSSISLTGFIGKAFEGAKGTHHFKHERGHGKEYVVYDEDDEECDEANDDDEDEKEPKKK